MDDNLKYKTGVYPSDRIMYEKLCRGEQGLTIEYKSTLKCNYFYGKDPFLRIGPFKLEEAFLDPRIVVYHDVMYDSEIEIIQDITREQVTIIKIYGGVLEVPSYIKLFSFQLYRSQIFNHTSNSPVYSDVRISKIFWLENNQHPVVDKIRRRAGHMTTLSMEFAEKFQIANYGIGGHYSAHQDYFSVSAN